MNMIYKKKLGRINYISYFCSLIAKYLNYRKATYNYLFNH